MATQAIAIPSSNGISKTKRKNEIPKNRRRDIWLSTILN